MFLTTTNKYLAMLLNYITAYGCKVPTYGQLGFLHDLKHSCLLLLLAVVLSNLDDFLQLPILQLAFLCSKIKWRNLCMQVCITMPQYRKIIMGYNNFISQFKSQPINSDVIHLSYSVVA